MSSAGSNASATRAAARGGAAAGAAKEKQRRETEAAEHRAALILEKKKREDAEKKALEVEEKLRKAETKAKAADARHRRLQKESQRESAARRHKSPASARGGSTDRATSLGDGAGDEAGGDGTGLLPPLPSSKSAKGDGGGERREPFLNAQQAALVELVDEERGGQEEDLRKRVSVMADAVVAAAAAVADGEESRELTVEKAGERENEGAREGEAEAEAGRGVLGDDAEEQIDVVHAPTSGMQEDTQSVAGDGQPVRSPAVELQRSAHTGAPPSSGSLEQAEAPAFGVSEVPGETLSSHDSIAAPAVVPGSANPPAHGSQGDIASSSNVQEGPPPPRIASRGGYDNEQDYEDMPIGSIAALSAPAPPPPAAPQGSADPSFSVEVSDPGRAEANAADTSAGFKGREWNAGSGPLVDETRADKPDLYDVSSPWQPAAGVQLAPERLAGEDGGPSRGQEQTLGEPHPQGMPIDKRLVYLSSAEQFRSELRVGSAGSKFVASESLEGLEGWRIGTSSTYMSQGPDALSLSTMFDDESLLPPALQASRRMLSVAAAADAMGAQDKENEKRCSSVTLVAKAEPSPLPEFGLHVEYPQESLSRPGVEEDQAVPLRKAKGKVDKTREEGVEVVFIPVLPSLAEGAEETKERIQEMQKVLGLPPCLWQTEAYRSEKIVIKPSDELRNARQVRSEEVSERIKGEMQPHITRASKNKNESDVPPPPEALRDQPPVNRGEAIEGAKQMGVNARSPAEAAKVAELVSVLRDSEWALNEFTRAADPVPGDDHWAPQGAGSAKAASVTFAQGSNAPGGPPVGARGETGEVVEIKFDVNLANDEEREAFARTQRSKLAKMLGLSSEDIEIVDVKPGSPVTVMRFRIGDQEASRIRSEGPQRSGGVGAEGAGIESSGPDEGSASGAEGIDHRAIQVDILTSSGPLAHQMLTERLRENLSRQSPNVTLRDSSAATAIASGPPQVNASKANDQRLGQTIGRVETDAQDASLERLLTHERSKGINDDSEPGAGTEYANEQISKPCELESQGDTGKDKASHVGPDAEVVENSHRPGRELMSDNQYSSAKVQRRGGKEAKRMKSDDLVQEMNYGLQGKVGFDECLDTERRKETEDELNFLPAQRADPGPRTAIMARKDDGLEAPCFDGLREHERRSVDKNIDQPTNQPSLHLEKSYQECNYMLKNKISGHEDPRTSIPSEPRDLGDDGRRHKKKGKEALKLDLPAVPEAYMAFGQDEGSQRLLPGIVTLEKPGAKGGKHAKSDWSDDEAHEVTSPELLKGKDLSSLAPDVVQIKFDVAFVDDESRQAFAEQQALKLAHLLQLPEHYISVRDAIPGSPMTCVTFDIVAGAAARSAGGRAEADGMARTNRPFESPVLEVAVISGDDDNAAALLELMKSVVGNQVLQDSTLRTFSALYGLGGLSARIELVVFREYGLAVAVSQV